MSFDNQVDDKYENTKGLRDNLNFLTGKIKSKPDGDFIHNIHTEWLHDYKKLEIHHGYIQWLFPLPTQGVNSEAHPLQKHELETLLKEHKEVVQQNLFESYKLMLDFYGMKLTNEKTGELERAKNYEERYTNLKNRPHNNLRITRILKCLGEFKMDIYQFGFLKFLIYETFETFKLYSLASSLLRFWIPVINNNEKKAEVIEYAKKFFE